MVDWNSRHSDIDARLQRIPFRVEPQDRAMLCDGVTQKNHINIVVKQLLILTRWFLPFQFAGQQNPDRFGACANFRKSCQSSL
jgi:hypothetical protein